MFERERERERERGMAVEFHHVSLGTDQTNTAQSTDEGKGGENSSRGLSV